jgi:hypothetical protein
MIFLSVIFVWNYYLSSQGWTEKTNLKILSVLTREHQKKLKSQGLKNDFFKCDFCLKILPVKSRLTRKKQDWKSFQSLPASIILVYCIGSNMG